MQHFLILCIALLSISEDTHDIHVSKAILKYKEEIRSWQLSLHVYSDDLESSLQLMGYDSLYLLTEKESSISDSAISVFLDNTFDLVVGEEKQKFHMLGIESAEVFPGMWIYAEVLDVDLKGNIEISNHIMSNLYNDQKNIVSIHIGKKQKMFIFDKKDHTKTLSWE